MRRSGIVFVLVAIMAVGPVWSAGLSDPEIEAEVIIAATEHDASKEDGLVLALWLMTVFAAMGGAFN